MPTESTSRLESTPVQGSDQPQPAKDPLAHLWKPGQSGNPGGRKKNRPITDRYGAVVEIPLPERIRKSFNAAGVELKAGATWGDAIAMAAVLEGIKTKNGVLARKELREALEGKSPQRLEIINPGEREKTELIVRIERAPVNNPRAVDPAQDRVEIGVRKTKTSVEQIAVTGTLSDDE